MLKVDMSAVSTVAVLVYAVRVGHGDELTVPDNSPEFGNNYYWSGSHACMYTRQGTHAKVPDVSTD